MLPPTSSAFCKTCEVYPRPCPRPGRHEGLVLLEVEAEGRLPGLGVEEEALLPRLALNSFIARASKAPKPSKFHFLAARSRLQQNES